MKPRQLKHKEVAEIRETILCEQQDGVCAICKKIPKRPTLDHHHTKRIHGTGLIRGVLESNMNVFLAKIENNATRYAIKHVELPTILRAVADYLEKEQYPLIHPSEAPKVPILTKRSYASLRKAYHNHYRGRKKLPEYPKSGKLTKNLQIFYIELELTPKFYKK